MAPLVIGALLQLVAAASTPPAEDSSRVLAQDARNPHLFSWKGRPTVLVGAPDHYGALLNLDFDYRAYLDLLARHNHTVLRVWSGAYREANGTDASGAPWHSFGIVHNTLNPRPLRFLPPWERSPAECCYADGGNKFDLSKISEAYMTRAEDFLGAAQQRGIVVELTLFSNQYDDRQWRVSPLHASNNVNGVEEAGVQGWYLTNNTRLMGFQRRMVVALLQRLNRFPNLYYEVANELADPASFPCARLKPPPSPSIPLPLSPPAHLSSSSRCWQGTTT